MITYHQIENAPRDAVYVWPSHDVTYARNLARFLRRTDLKIVSQAWLVPEHTYGLRRAIVVDHHCELRRSERLLVRNHNLMRHTYGTAV